MFFDDLENDEAVRSPEQRKEAGELDQPGSTEGRPARWLDGRDLGRHGATP